MGKQKTTTEGDINTYPAVLRRSKRQLNRQKNIPIQSFLNSDPAVTPIRHDNTSYVSNDAQDSSHLIEDKPNATIVPTDNTSATITNVPTQTTLIPTTKKDKAAPKRRSYKRKPKDNSTLKKKSTVKKSKGSVATGKNKATLEEVMETQIANHHLPISPKTEYDHERLRFLLQDQTSYLASAELKAMIPVLLSALPQKDLDELAQLLPYTDKKADGSFSLDFASASNNFFWEAAAKWQDVLYLGGFDEKKMANKKKKVKAQEDASFKDENYESYWGERLKRDRAMKEQSTTKKR